MLNVLEGSRSVGRFAVCMGCREDAFEDRCAKITDMVNIGVGLLITTQTKRTSQTALDLKSPAVVVHTQNELSRFNGGGTGFYGRRFPP
jgi:hypothetical protein